MKKLLLTTLSVFFLFSCSDDENNSTAPVLTTTSITNITNNSATSGGIVTSDGGANITARGVVWSTSPIPTIELSTKTVDGTGTGSFTSSITGLLPNTTYYVRAYATNSAGTSYGNEITFTTVVDVTTGLIAFYPFNGNSNDASNNGNNGIVNGAILTTDRNGTLNSSYSFSNGNNISIPMTQQLHNLPIRTFCCWFKMNNNQNGGRIFDTTYFNGGISINNNVLDAWYYSGARECNVTNTTINLINEWHFLVYTTNSNNGEGKIYLDGNLVNSRTGGPFNAPQNWLNSFLRIGVGAQGEAINGKIDDIRIYNRLLNQSEISYLFSN
jgi:antitoxin component YwqK of YwqJK toxin-antitoxin module